MNKIRNILFVMYDQLRHDYLGCTGHPTLKTPHFDRLAARSLRFTQCYVQSPVCGPSRMSFYTGRYVHSHGAAWNNFPLKVGEMTLGDHLRTVGMDAYLVGKTHMKVDDAGLERLGISRGGVIGARVAEAGFDVFERDDGLWAKGPDGFYDRSRSPYNAYLNSRGYGGDNPWHDFANAGVDENGEMATGFALVNAARAANIREEDSETPWLTSRAIDFLDTPGREDKPWLCHLSYIKPHWPYIVPAPYHDMYSGDDVMPVNRCDAERIEPHPVHACFMNNVVGKSFHDSSVRDTVVAAYMGLVKQCDDQFGRLLDHLEARGRLDDTMIVVTSDHGDYLGDHWLGEKDLFHAPSVRVPLIVYDPRAKADATRGGTCDALTESIDLAATFVDVIGGEVPDHILEGRSLEPWLQGDTPDWRDFAVSEYDYSATSMAVRLGLEPKQARLFMIADARYTFMHAEGDFRPMLFDREQDPAELHDLGGDPGSARVRALMQERLSAWARRPSQRTTLSDADIVGMRGASRRKGVLLGLVDGSEVDAELLSAYTGRPPGRPEQETAPSSTAEAREPDR